MNGELIVSVVIAPIYPVLFIIWRKLEWIRANCKRCKNEPE